MNRKCRVCGCTDQNACIDEDEFTCYWVEPDLCSACVEHEEVDLPLVALATEGDANNLIREMRRL